MKLKKDGTLSHQGEGGGKPPIFEKEEEFKQALLDYFKYCVDSQIMPNVAGFCARFFVGRNTFYDYGKKYPNTKKAFESIVEDVWVNRLKDSSATGAIFYLKNAFREFYKDRTETDITSGGRPIPILKGLTTKNVSKNKRPSTTSKT